MKTVPIFLLLALTCAAQAQTAPPQATTNRFTKLAFTQSFPTAPDVSGNDWAQGEVWSAEFPWSPPYPVPTQMYQPLPEGGPGVRILGGAALINHPSTHAAWGPAYLTGYWEVKARFRGSDGGADSFGSVMLMAKEHYENADAGLMWTNAIEEWCEIDAFEAWGHNSAVVSVIDWIWPVGASGPIHASINANNYNTGLSIDPIDGNWHIFGLLKLVGSLSWYIDNVLIATAPTPAVCDRQHPVLSIEAGSHSGRTTQTTDVDWVNIWQPVPWATAAQTRTTVKAGGTIIDAAGNVWAFSPATTPPYGNKIIKNGVAPSYGGIGTTLVLDANGVLWLQNGAGQWHKDGGTTWIAEASGPTT